MISNKQKLPPSVKRLTCLFCRYFYFEPSEHDYSFGTEASLGCGKNYWQFNDIDSDVQFREKMLNAETCEDFIIINMEEVTK